MAQPPTHIYDIPILITTHQSLFLPHDFFCYSAGNPHNRIGIKDTAPNLQKALLCADAFAYGRTAGWKMTQNILNPDNVDEDGLKNLFESIDTDHSGANQRAARKPLPRPEVAWTEYLVIQPISV